MYIYVYTYMYVRIYVFIRLSMYVRMYVSHHSTAILSMSWFSTPVTSSRRTMSYSSPSMSIFTNTKSSLRTLAALRCPAGG